LIRGGYGWLQTVHWFLLSFLLTFGACAAVSHVGKCFAYHSAAANGQDAVVSQCRFICLHANTSIIFKAGPLSVTGASAITIDSTTAYDSWVVRATVYASWGRPSSSIPPVQLQSQTLVATRASPNVPSSPASEADSWPATRSTHRQCWRAVTRIRSPGLNPTGSTSKT
jgi:hypothetical protein